MSIDQRIRDGLRATNDHLPAPDVDAALATVTAGGRTTHRANLMAAMAAAAAAVLVIVGVLAVTRDGNDSREPTGPATSETSAPVSPMANGPLVSAEKHFARALEPCFVPLPDGEPDTQGLDCQIFARDVDVVSGIGLFAESHVGSRVNDSVRVVTPDAVIAKFRCPYEGDECYPAVGPGSDEISFPHGREITVVGFDGRDRRTIDLSDVLAPPAGRDKFGEEILTIDWSPDRTRVAVTTRHITRETKTMVSQIWLFDPDGGHPQLLHTATNTLPIPTNAWALAYIASTTWSPDGGRLGFIEEYSWLDGIEESQSIRAASLDLAGSGSSVPKTLYDYITTPYDEAAIVWSPDGARVAVAADGQVLELSAEDGRILAQHPMIEGTLTWLARQP